MGSVPERHRRERYDGLELASDPSDRADERDFVVGVGPAGQTLAALTIRRPVASALDLGTGQGLQALRAARHAERVVAVDVNARALEYAAHNAELNGIENVEWRQGSWFEPVAEERFDLIVANPPYVISPESGLTYRDSGEPGDALVLRLLGELPAYLEEGGFGQLLCNFVPRPGDWPGTIKDATAESGCDVVVLKYSDIPPDEYAEGWNQSLRSADHRAFDAAVERWVTHYREQGIDSIAFGMVILRRRSDGPSWFRAIHAPGGPTEGAGEHVERLFTGRDWELANPDVAPRLSYAADTRIVRRVALPDGEERARLEVYPNAGFAVPLRGSWPPEAPEIRRLIGLGMLLTPDSS
jgi:methylase of polypeptide subunit release factors